MHAPVPAAVTPGGGVPYPQALGSGSSSMYGDVDFLQPYMDVLPRWMLCDMYKDIYHHDAVAGAAVDLMANLPFSDFELRLPVEDPGEKMRSVFEENLDRLRVNTLLPATTRESHVFGAYISILIYDQTRKMFTDTVPFEYRNAEVRSNVLYGGDPTIEVQLSAEQKAFLNGLGAADTAAYQSVANKMDPELLALMKTGRFELDSLSAIYIPRKPFSFSDVGESVYRRMLPIYLIEKSLMRGTIHMANRRQNPIMHIQVGNDEWEPTEPELDSYLEQVIESDQDPLGAVLATRNDVNIVEVGSAGQFWKWGDESDSFNNRKFLALGISESFLCVKHDTLVNTTDRGLVKIDEIADTSSLEKDQSVNIDIKVEGYYGRPVTATKLWYRGDAPVSVIHTIRGKTVETTDDHLILVKSPDQQSSSLYWKKAKNLTADDYLAISGLTEFEQFANREPTGVHSVYDLTIDSCLPAFCANGGIVVHNSGDANWSSLEHALTVFLEMLRALRRDTTNQFFYNKVFPLISSIHEFTHERYGDKAKQIVDADGNPIRSDDDKKEESRAGYRYWTNDVDIGYTGGLIIPIIEYEKKLMPEGDAERLEVMERLAEKGVPFPLRTWAAIGGYSLDQLVREMENSTSVELTLKQVMDDREKVLGPPKGEGDDGGGSDEFFSLLRGVGVANREYPEDASEIAGQTKTGRRRYMRNQHQLNRMMDQRIMRVLADLAKKARR